MAAVKKHKIKLREVNRHLVCRLCRGYYVDATTIAECLHSFCRSCIITYLEKNSFCPICEVQIHETKPYLNLRLDKTLQDVVYKLVPGLYHKEMKKRREFYAKHPEQVPLVTPEQCGLEERLIFSPEDSISLSLEYLESQDYETDSISSRSSESGGDNQDGLSFPQQLGLMKLKTEGKNSRRESQDVQDPASHPKRYLQCPASVNVSHLKKFIKMKYDLTDRQQVDIIHKRVPLPDHYTLMDVAYIYTWKRSAPMRFFFQINEVPRKEKVKIAVPPVKSESEQTKPITNSENPKPVQETVVKPDSNREPASACATETSDKPQKTENTENNKIKTDKIVPNSKPEEKLDVKVINPPDKTIVARVDPPKQTPANDKPVKTEENKINVKICDTKPSEKIKESNNVKTNVEVVKKEIEIKSPEVKESKKDLNLQKTTAENELKQKDKVLLNPYSGKLETVPSKTPEIKEKPEKDKSNNKSNVNSLKSFRREKSVPNQRDNKVQLKIASGDLLTITTTTKKEKPFEKEEANVSIEIKTDNKSSEYDFDSSSPPNKISMSLKEYTKSEQFKNISKIVKCGSPNRNQVKENGKDEPKKEKSKTVPSLYRINSDQNKKMISKTPNGKIENNKPEENKKSPPTVINIKTENQKSDVEIETSELKPEKLLPPKPIKLENPETGKNETKKQTNGESNKKIDTLSPEQSKELLRGLLKRMNNSADKDAAKKAKLEEEKKKNDLGVIDLSKPENVKHEKNPLENLADMARKPGDGKNHDNVKNHDNMVEMLIAAAQKQSIEPLLKIPQFQQSLKYPPPQISPTQGKSFPPGDITHALQFFMNLKNQFDPNSQISQNAHHLNFLQQNMELNALKRMKKPQILESPQPRKHMKLSPTLESKPTSPSDLKPKSSPPKNSPKKEEEQLKLTIERTLSQIQAHNVYQNQMMANYTKGMPQLFQFMQRPPTMYRPDTPSPAKINPKPKSSHSPNSQKSPQGTMIPTSSGLNILDPQVFSSEEYARALSNSKPNSNITYNDMFQLYINKINEFNQMQSLENKEKKSSSKQNNVNNSNDFYCGAQNEGKKQTEHSSPIATSQKT